MIGTENVRARIYFKVCKHTSSSTSALEFELGVSWVGSLTFGFDNMISHHLADTVFGSDKLHASADSGPLRGQLIEER